MQNNIEDNTQNTQESIADDIVKDIPDLLLRKGLEFYRFGKNMFLVLAISMVTFTTLIVFIEITADYSRKLYDCLALHSSSFLINLLFLLSYGGILLGIVGAVLYLIGLHYLGLGHIARNTMPKNETDTK